MMRKRNLCTWTADDDDDDDDAISRQSASSYHGQECHDTPYQKKTNKKSDRKRTLFLCAEMNVGTHKLMIYIHTPGWILVMKMQKCTVINEVKVLNGCWASDGCHYPQRLFT